MKKFGQLQYIPHLGYDYTPSQCHSIQKLKYLKGNDDETVKLKFTDVIEMGSGKQC
jgi:hypothetical protein